LGKQPRYDAVGDFTPVGLVSVSPITFVVRSDMPVNDLADLKALVTAHPQGLSIAHGGYGTPSHFGAVKLKTALGAEYLLEKTYASTMAVLEDIATGQADIMATSLPQALPFIKAGKVKALGLASVSRNIALPETYTGTQQGFAELWASHWNGLFAPKGLKPETQAWLATGLAKTLADPATRRKMFERGMHVPFVEQQGPDALARLQQREIAELAVVA
jgi:tripartite-type tricarboxylate transporter receptor subunit TctC